MLIRNTIQSISFSSIFKLIFFPTCISTSFLLEETVYGISLHENETENKDNQQA